MYCIVERSTSLDLLKLERNMLTRKYRAQSSTSVYVCIHKGVISFLITYSERYLDQYSSDTRVRHVSSKRDRFGPRRSVGLNYTSFRFPV